MKMAVEHNNLTDVKGDGRIMIYQRPRRDGSIIPTWHTYDEKDNKRSLYSLRHFYATQRLTDEVNPFLLARQMGTSIEMLQKFYGQPVTRLVARQITKTDTDIKPKQQIGNAYPFEAP